MQQDVKKKVLITIIIALLFPNWRDYCFAK